MQRIAGSLILSLFAGLILVACSPSEADNNALVTEIAADIFATQTAETRSSRKVPTEAETAVPSVTVTSTPIPTATPEPTRTPPATQTLSPTPIWQSYTSNERGFSIQYPYDWTVIEKEAYIEFLGKDTWTWALVSIIYSERNAQKIIEDAISDDILIEQGTHTFNGVDWVYAIYQVSGDVTIIDMYVRMDPSGRAYIFMGSSHQDAHITQTKVYIQMMESLQEG